MSTQQNEDQVTVHSWACHDFQPISSQELLDKGRFLVRAASRVDRWFQPVIKASANIRSCGAAFEYSQHAPRCDSLDVRNQVAMTDLLQEWSSDVTVDENEAFRLEDLEEFQNSDLTCVFHKPSITALIPAMPPANQLAPGLEPKRSRKGIIGESCSDEPPRKRPRLDHSSLSKLLPQPHFHPSVFSAGDFSPSDIGRNAFYPKLTSRPVPPHTEEAMQEYLADPYARGAWIIPVRGTLPWDDCTSASILAAPSTLSQEVRILLPSGPSSRPGQFPADLLSDEITWTHHALSTFWEFLLAIRDAGTLGPLSLSFHAAPVTDPAESSWSNALLPGNHEHYGIHRSATDNSFPPLRSPLFSVDHIKVYHDTQYTKHVRNVLYAWSYSCVLAEDGSVHDAPQVRQRGKREASTSRMGKDLNLQKIRMLKGARLVLVDEKSKAVLTC
ncbi:hypothetical protein BKA93DRAFT_128543 [Sparassis latifolia]|uniref:Uncharacterized protein n=1 Tax=Sparassis crispa TaxID=139825 RepID=A0A401GMX9_9APHY|nr:hypothetical protein SCP_0506180 [Sparassis crispa]GBE83563.1 hypothetical protein SCP_0506180 [Sparassis crispa]